MVVYDPDTTAIVVPSERVRVYAFAGVGTGGKALFYPYILLFIIEIT
jgi:hypothetical protein